MESLLGTCHRCPRCHAPLELMESPNGFHLSCPNYPFCARFDEEDSGPSQHLLEDRYAEQLAA